MERTIAEYIEKARKAQEEIKDYTQEQVDKLCYEAAKIIYKNAEPLAKMAVEETGFGSVEDKIGKNTDTPAAFWDYLKDKPSVGIINERPGEGIIEIAHPIGVIACITPATNPTVTPLGNFMHVIKGKNAGIVSAAPRAKNTTGKTVDLIREALTANGAPADLFQMVEGPTLAKSQELMEKADLVIATGSSGLTKAAYSSGTPAYGVGPGNPPVILDSDFDLKEAASITKVAVGSDNGILCDGDNQLLYPKDEEKALTEALEAEGIVVFENKEDIDKLRAVIFKEDGKINPGIIGKDAALIASAAGINIPADTKVIAIKQDGIDGTEVLNKEIMGPVVILKKYETFSEAVKMAVANMEESGGIGHTAGILSHNDDHIREAIEQLPVARVLINQPTPDAWGPSTNSLSPAVSESCGTWGNNVNIEGGNVDYKHMINITTAVTPLDIEVPDAAKMFAD